MLSGRLVSGVLSLGAAATLVHAQVTVTSVDRHVGATACVFAPSNYPEWCDSDANNNATTGYWISSVVFGNSAAGDVGYGSAITVPSQESSVTSEGFIVSGGTKVELESEGICGSTGLSLSSMTVGFTVFSPCQAVLSGYLNGPNTAELRITLRRGDGSLMYTYAGNFDASLELEVGDYQYFASGIADGSCSGSCDHNEHVNWHSEINFQPLACPADLNGDELVEDADFVIFVGAYNELLCPETPAECPADFNHDGLVDDTDFVIFVGAYDDLICP